MGAGDVPRYVSSGAVDCGVTGADLVAESGAPVVELLRLGYGRCRLEVAVPEEAEVTGIYEMHGRRLATVHPRLTHKLLSARGVDAEIVTLGGSTEIAPRLGLVDGIVDLVSSGATLRRHALRSIGPLFFSEAVVWPLNGTGPARASHDRRQVDFKVPPPGAIRRVDDARADDVGPS